LWVDQVAEGLVYRTKDQEQQARRQRSRDYIAISLINEHSEAFIEVQSSNDDAAEEMVRGVLKEIKESIQGETYHAEILTSEPDQVRTLRNFVIRLPDSQMEKTVMKELEDAARTIELPLKNSDAKNNSATATANDDLNGPSDVAEQIGSLTRQESANLFREKIVVDETKNTSEYHYFQTVYFADSCKRCHPTVQAAGALPASADVSGIHRYFEPFHVVSISFPFRQSKAEVHQIRAILSFAGIIVFFVAMVSLYAIVRYVIVSPLKHLRDVSDSISHGKTDLRADIHTNDEFEDLAASFNRMLRHLTDTQGNLLNVNRELDAKVDELAQLNMRLYEMNRLKSDFLANMSHELRTPLNSIIGFSEVLQSIDSLSDKQKRYAQNIQKSGRVLLDMINDILDLAKIDAGKMELRPSEFRVEQVIHGQCDVVRGLMESKNIDLMVEVAPGMPPMYQDQGKLQQILTNLLSNAIKFTPEGGRIAVRAERDVEGRLVLTVADTGVGIADEDREVIFEKFRQSRAVIGDDNLTREYSGTGLGLSIVKELCKLMRGEIDFESELGKGSTFRVVLPWTYDDLPAGDSALTTESQVRMPRLVSRG
jgi:signal transduction histidine kinase